MAEEHGHSGRFTQGGAPLWGACPRLVCGTPLGCLPLRGEEPPPLLNALIVVVAGTDSSGQAHNKE